jgi:hypothetical protein
MDYLYNPEFWRIEWNLSLLQAQSYLLPLLAGLLTWHVHRPEHRRILAFVVYSLVMDHLARDADTEFLFHESTNSPWYHLLVPGLFFLMTRFFADFFRDIGRPWLAWTLPLVFTVLVILNAIWGDGFYRFPAGVVALYSLTGIVLAIGYFAHLLQNLNELFLERQPMFWIAAGLLLYFAGNFLLWLGLNELVANVELFRRVYWINRVAVIILNLAFVIAIVLNPAKRTIPDLVEYRS